VHEALESVSRYGTKKTLTFARVRPTFEEKEEVRVATDVADEAAQHRSHSDEPIPLSPRNQNPSDRNERGGSVQHTVKSECKSISSIQAEDKENKPIASEKEKASLMHSHHSSSRTNK